jgi:hypothetical protein
MSAAHDFGSRGDLNLPIMRSMVNRQSDSVGLSTGFQPVPLPIRSADREDRDQASLISRSRSWRYSSAVIGSG